MLRRNNDMQGGKITRGGKKHRFRLYKSFPAYYLFSIGHTTSAPYLDIPEKIGIDRSHENHKNSLEGNVRECHIPRTFLVVRVGYLSAMLI